MVLAYATTFNAARQLTQTLVLEFDVGKTYTVKPNFDVTFQQLTRNLK